MTVRIYYNHIFYEDIEIGDIKTISEEDVENFKKTLDEMKNKKTYNVLVFDSLGTE